MKLGFPVRMHFDRLKFTYLALSHFRINKHLAQLDKHKTSEILIKVALRHNLNSIGFKNCS